MNNEYKDYAEINGPVLRAIADRIDGQFENMYDENGEQQIAFYNQNALIDIAFLYQDKIEPANITKECETECCIAGHALILKLGFPDYLQLAYDEFETIRHIIDEAADYLGLTKKQSDALLAEELELEKLHDAFPILSEKDYYPVIAISNQWPDEPTYIQHYDDVAELLRTIAESDPR